MLPNKIIRQVIALCSRPDAAGDCQDADDLESATDRSLGLFRELDNRRRGFREGSVMLWFDSRYSWLSLIANQEMLCH